MGAPFLLGCWILHDSLLRHRRQFLANNTVHPVNGYRGPNGSGVSTSKTVPTVWTEKDINWKVSLPGPGHSSPVLWGDRIFLTTGDATTNQVWVLCLKASQGQVLWQRGFPISAYHKNAFNTVASGSPAVDAHRVYACWTTPERFTFAAFDHDGKSAWERNLGPFVGQHGGGASPIVFGDEVILANQQDGESFVIAVDAATGHTRWQAPRKTTEASYATPCVYEADDSQPVLVFASHSHGFSGIDPASGKVLWELAGVFDKRVVSSPVLAAGLIIGACGSGEGGSYLVAARPGNPKTAKPAEVAYTIRRSAPYVPTSICVGELLFLWGDDGTVTCLQAGTGAMKWQEHLGKHYFGSPVCVDGRLFAVSTSGEVAVVRASDHFELLARNALGETTHSTPAVAGGRMYIHTSKHLFSIGGTEAGAASVP